MSPEALLSALTRLVDDLTEPARPTIITLAANEGDDIEALLAERYAAAGLPPDAPVMTIVTLLGDAEPPPYQALPPREVGPEPEPEPPLEPDPVVLARIVRMARTRRLRIHHTGPDIALSAVDGEIQFAGTVAEVYAALKRDTVTALPPDPVQELRERLLRAATGWSLEDIGDGHYALCRCQPLTRIYSGPLDDLTVIAERKIFNTVPGRGYAV